MSTLLPKWPYFDPKQISSATEVLHSGKVNYWTGNKCKTFEDNFGKYVECKYSISVANGSLALSLAYLACGISSGDEVITSPRTFVATASSISLLQATPVFADVDINSGNITATSIEKVITSKTKAIAVVHLAGWPANMIEIRALALKHGIYVIEDCSQAHGAKILEKGVFKSVGSFGDIATWSFCQDKIISTGGEGGMVTTNNKIFWEKMWSMKDHGKDYKLTCETSYPPGFRWLHSNLGSNFRLTEFQSAIGIEQIKLLDNWTALRDRNARIIIDALMELENIRIPLPSDEYKHAWYKFYCYLIPEKLSKTWNRTKIITEIQNKGYPAFEGSCSEVYREKCFNHNKNLRLKNAKSLGQTSLMFLVHPTISKEQMKEYAEVIKTTLMKANDK